MKKKEISILIFFFIASVFFITAANIKAGPLDNVWGWAWSNMDNPATPNLDESSIGWISFNNITDGASTNYGVHICTDESDTNLNCQALTGQKTGRIVGYAWSENIGWVNFAPLSPYPFNPQYSSCVDLPGVDQGACDISGNYEVSGWARALAYDGASWDGWIKLRCYLSECASSSYGVYLENYGGEESEFRNWAWGGDVIGWVSFNCKDTGSCSDADYQVSTNFTVIQADNTPPEIISFDVQPRILGLAQINDTISWHVVDTGGAHLNRVEVWRAPDNNNSPGAWSRQGEYFPPTNSEDNWASSTIDSPNQGIWWYKMYVYDNNPANDPAESSAIKVIVDKTPPLVNLFDVQPRELNNSVLTAVISWQVSDSGGSFLDYVNIWRSSDYNGATGTWVQIPGSGSDFNAPENTNSWATTSTDSPPDGTYWYGIHVADNAGNVTVEPNPIKIIVDKIGPVIDAFDVVPNRLNIATPTALITWTVSDLGGSGIDYLKVFRAPDVAGNPGTWAQIGPDRDAGTSTSIWSFFTSDSPANGTYWYRIDVYDETGNKTSSMPEGPIIVDKTAPVIDSFTVAPTVLSSTTPTTVISWTVSDAGGSHLYYVRILRALNASGTPGTWTEINYYTITGDRDSWTSSTTDNPAEGTYFYTIIVSDKNGNETGWPSPIMVNKNLSGTSEPVSSIWRWDSALSRWVLDDPNVAKIWYKTDFTRRALDLGFGAALKNCFYDVYSCYYPGGAPVCDATVYHMPRNCDSSDPNSRTGNNLNVSVGPGKNCYYESENSCLIYVYSVDENNITSNPGVAIHHTDWTPPSVGAITPTTAKQNEQVTLYATTSDNLEVGYCWLQEDIGTNSWVNRGPMIVPSCKNGTVCQASINYTFTTAGTHKVRATCADHYEPQINGYLNIANGPTTNLTVSFNHDPVIISLTASSSPCLAPTTQPGCMIYFDAIATDIDGDTLTYNWNFGDENTATGQNTSHHYYAVEDYEVKLTVSDGYGGVDTATIIISVEAPTLSVDLIANPPAGLAPLNKVDLQATAYGTMFGTIIYSFDCHNDGTYDFTTPAVDINPYSWDDKCDYPSVGNYTAKVKIERGVGCGGDVECTGSEDCCNIRKIPISVGSSECVPGETRSCPSNGCTFTQTCLLGGVWSDCGPADQCVAGSTSAAGCPAGQVKTCTAGCVWGTCVGGTEDCSLPVEPCPVCSHRDCIEGSWTSCLPETGNDCGDCRVCQAGSCTYQCDASGINESNCQCIEDVCRDCSEYFDPGGPSCRYQGACNCGFCEKPVWACSLAKCRCSCVEDLNCPGCKQSGCSDFDPSVTITPSSQSGLPGATQFIYTVSVANNYRGKDCSSVDFSLSNLCPIGWNCSFDSTFLTIDAGRSKETLLRVNIPSAKKGIYTIVVTATVGGIHSGSDSATFQVLNSPPVAAISCNPTGCLLPAGQCAGYTGCPFTLVNQSIDNDGNNDIISSDWKISSITGEVVLNPAPCSGRCNLTPLLQKGNYIAELKVTDKDGASDVTTKNFKILQDAIADFKCSLTQSGDWQNCDGMKVAQGARVYFHSISTGSEDPVTGFTRSLNHSWSFEDGSPASASGNILDTSATFERKDASSGRVTLIVDDGIRTDIRTYQLRITIPLPKWQEIPPF